MFNRKKNVDIKKIEIIVMEGCGVRWHAYDSALQELVKVKDWKDIKKMAASSGGSMPAFLAAIGNLPEKIGDITTALDLNELIDPVSLNTIPYLGNVFSFFLYHGFVKGSKIRQFAEKQLKNQNLSADITFEELANLIKNNQRPDLKYLYLAAAVVTRGSQLVIFSHETTPDIRIADALVAALAYPGSGIPAKVLFEHNLEYFFDGGVRDNFIVNYFSKTDPGKVLGLKIDNYAEIFGYPYQYPSTVEFFYSLVQDNHQDFLQESHHYSLQLYDCGLTTLNMPLTKLQNFALHVSGKLNVANFIKNRLVPEGPIAPPHLVDNENQKALSKRTNMLLRHLQDGTLTLKQIALNITDWQKNNNEDYVYYGPILQELKTHSGILWNNSDYIYLSTLLKNAGALFAEKNTASAIDISAMLMAFLNDGEIERCAQLFRKLVNGENESKLIDIDHIPLLKKLNETWSFKNRVDYQLLKNSFEELHNEKLKLFPGAYEAHKIMQLNQLIVAREFNQAEQLLMKENFNDLRADLLTKLYLVTQDQVEKMQATYSDSLLKFLESKTGKVVSQSPHDSSSFMRFFKKPSVINDKPAPSLERSLELN